MTKAVAHQPSVRDDQTRELLEEMLEPLDHGELVNQLSNLVTASQNSKALDGVEAENLYEEVSQGLKTAGVEEEINYSSFRSLGRQIDEQQDYLQTMIDYNYDSLREKWVERFETANRVAQYGLGRYLAEWLTEEWLEQAVLTTNLEEVMRKVIDQRAWREILPKMATAMGKVGKLGKGKIYSAWGPERFERMCFMEWKRGFGQLTLAENLELLAGLERTGKAYRESLVVPGTPPEGSRCWTRKLPAAKAEADPQKEEGKFSRLLRQEAWLILQAGGSALTERAEMLGKIVHQYGIKARELEWEWGKGATGILGADRLEVTGKFFTGLADPGFFAVRGKAGAEAETGAGIEASTKDGVKEGEESEYDQFVKRLLGVVKNGEQRRAMEIRARKIGLEQALQAGAEGGPKAPRI